MRSWGNASASGGVGKSGGGVKTGGARMRVARSGFVKGFRMPASHCARGCTEAGVRKASKEETAGEDAPAAVSGYGDLVPAFDLIFRSRIGTAAERALRRCCRSGRLRTEGRWRAG